jgi:hypothetical protein
LLPDAAAATRQPIIYEYNPLTAKAITLRALPLGKKYSSSFAKAIFLIYLLLHDERNAARHLVQSRRR